MTLAVKRAVVGFVAGAALPVALGSVLLVAANSTDPTPECGNLAAYAAMTMVYGGACCGALGSIYGLLHSLSDVVAKRLTSD